MRMSEKFHNSNYNNNSSNPLTSRRTDGGKKTETQVNISKNYTL